MVCVPRSEGKAEVRRETAARSYGPNAEHYIVLGKGQNGRECILSHTAATKMAEAGVPESTMLAIMGHMSRRCSNATATSAWLRNARR